MIIGGLFILLLAVGTIYFKILPLFPVKQVSESLPASEEILKTVVVGEQEKGLDMLAQEISAKKNMEEKKEEEIATISGNIQA